MFTEVGHKSGGALELHAIWCYWLNSNETANETGETTGKLSWPRNFQSKVFWRRPPNRLSLLERFAEILRNVQNAHLAFARAAKNVFIIQLPIAGRAASRYVETTSRK